MYVIAMLLLKRYIKRVHDNNVSEFARAFGFDQGRVYHWLHGRRFPNRMAALKIVRRTGIPLNALLSGNHRKEKSGGNHR